MMNVTELFQITVGSSSQALSNGNVGMKHFAPVNLISSDSVESSSCTPFEPPGSVPPFTCILALFPPIPEISVKDVFEANAIYAPGEGEIIAYFTLFFSNVCLNPYINECFTE